MNNQKYTKEQFAALITGREYGNEITKEEEEIAKDSGLFDIGPKGIIQIDEDDVEVLEKYKVLDVVTAGTHKLEAKFGTSSASWVYKTDLPHATFDIYEGDGEDQELFCIGIVIDVEDFTRQPDPDAATPFFPQLSPASGDASGSPAVAKCVPVGDPPTLAGVYGSTDSGGVSGEEVAS